MDEFIEELESLCRRHNVRLYQLPSQFKSSNENGGIIPYT